MIHPESPYIEFIRFGILHRHQIVVKGITCSIHHHDSSSTTVFDLDKEVERANYVVHLFRHMTVFVRFVPNNDGDRVV